MSRKELGFVDTHVHFHDLDHPDLRYTWLEAGGDPDEAAVLGEYGAIRAERYRAEDFIGEARFAGLAGAVHVQAALGSADPVVETHWLDSIADRVGLPNAIVAHADLNSNTFIDTLDRHSRSTRFRGIRDLGLSRTRDSIRTASSVREMSDRGLVLCDAPELDTIESTVRLIARAEGLTYCVDHAMMPLERSREYFDYWRKGLRTIADIPHAVIKISGLGQTDHRWTIDSIRPWVLACIDAFGVDRCFFGSNWPVDRLYSSYPDLIAAYRSICETFSDSEAEGLLSGNARRVFKLD